MLGDTPVALQSVNHIADCLLFFLFFSALVLWMFPSPGSSQLCPESRCRWSVGKYLEEKDKVNDKEMNPPPHHSDCVAEKTVDT